MIKVGVNENVFLSKAEINEKGTLLIGFREIGSELKEKAVSMADEMSGGSDTSGASSGESTHLLFLPALVKYEKDAAGNEQPEEGKVILASFLDLKNQLSHILKRFTTANLIKFSPFAGVTEINPASEADILEKIVNKPIAEKIYTNYISQFVAQVTPFLNLETKPARLFLHRQSETSHFGKLRKKFLGDQPFFEDTLIPVSSSKMYTNQLEKGTKHHEPVEVDGIKYVPKFSEYELKNKLDNPHKIETQPDASSAAAEQEIQNVETLFSADAGASAEGFQLEGE